MKNPTAEQLYAFINANEQLIIDTFGITFIDCDAPERGLSELTIDSLSMSMCLQEVDCGLYVRGKFYGGIEVPVCDLAKMMAAIN